MIFQHTWEKVLSGEKTQTRRIVKTGQRLVSIEDAFGGYRPLHLSSNGHILYAIGRDYAVQPGRGEKAIARIKITRISREDVRSIRFTDCIDEGFGSYRSFFETWCGMHDKSALSIVRDFTLIPTLRMLLLKRPAERYQAWALTFDLVKP